MYVAQPQTYLWGYSAVILTVWAHWRICGNPHAAMRDYVFFGGILALALLTYDLLTLLLYLAGYELLFKRRKWPIAVSASLAGAIYVAFGLLTAHMTSFVHDNSNSKFIGLSVTNAIAALRSNPLALKNYVLYDGLLWNYVWNLSNAVFVFPLLVAIVGLFCLNSPPKLKLVGLLFLPSFAGAAFLYLGQTALAAWPRFTFCRISGRLYPLQCGAVGPGAHDWLAMGRLAMEVCRGGGGALWRYTTCRPGQRGCLRAPVALLPLLL